MKNYTTHFIKEGDVIDGLGGYLEIDHYNGSGLYYANEYEIIDGDGNVEFVGNNPFTSGDIEHYMRDADGRNHKVFYAGCEDDPEMIDSILIGIVWRG